MFRCFVLSFTNVGVPPSCSVIIIVFCSLQDAPDGITLEKYQELYAGFIANENTAGADLSCLYLFGPLCEIN